MKNRKSVTILFVVASISLICCITLIVIAAHKPGSPEFCARCHSMEPFYNSWKDAVSCNTGCLNCHTHDDSGRTLSVEIEDSNCTNTECHPVEKLTSKVSDYKDKFSFNHKTHLEAYPTNLKLKCTGCHSYLGQDIQEDGKINHFDIDENSCFICHFRRGKNPLLTARDKIEVDECSLCHKNVEVELLLYGKVFDHLNFEKDERVKCADCHFDTVQRGGDVEEKNCYHCHTKLPKEYQGAERMHRDHVEKHKVPCTPCHNEILHEWGDEYVANILPERNAVPGDMDSLMTTVVTSRKSRKGASVDTRDQESVFEKVPYLIQRKLYAGKGGIGIEESPDPMYLALVNCTACHKNRDLGVHPLTCNICHKKGFDKTMEEQKEYIRNKLNSLSELINNTPKKGVSETLVDEVRYNYNLIVNDGSFGVHNIKYVKDLINYSIERLKDISLSDTN
ncbi:MAG: cytochrome c3 family protein [Candidatus Scalindua sp.]|nr:cytochrome c3 family protein [Candidatus Scalindua sp.]